jgi:hypothetical protein
MSFAFMSISFAAEDRPLDRFQDYHGIRPEAIGPTPFFSSEDVLFCIQSLSDAMKGIRDEEGAAGWN